MTSVINLFSNFNDLSKPKTIIDTPSNYNKKNTEPDMLKTSLQQGSKFKKYQNKIIKKTKLLNNLENPYNLTNLKEGFQGLPNLHLNKNMLKTFLFNYIYNNFRKGPAKTDQLIKMISSLIYIIPHENARNKLIDYYNRFNLNRDNFRKWIYGLLLIIKNTM